MSRTFRRRKAKKPYSRFEQQYTHYRLADGPGLVGLRYPNCTGPLVSLEGKAFFKAYWHYHSDSGCAGFAFENWFGRPVEEAEGPRRARYKHEIIKWMKNPDYEIQLQRPKDEWDYC